METLEEVRNDYGIPAVNIAPIDESNLCCGSTIKEDRVEELSPECIDLLEIRKAEAADFIRRVKRCGYKGPTLSLENCYRLASEAACRGDIQAPSPAWNGIQEQLEKKVLHHKFRDSGGLGVCVCCFVTLQRGHRVFDTVPRKFTRDGVKLCGLFRYLFFFTHIHATLAFTPC